MIKTKDVHLKDYLEESHLFQNIIIRTDNCDESPIQVNSFVLAAASPLLKKCLTDLKEEESQIIITECSIKSLSLALEYLHVGYVETPDENFLIEVRSILDNLQIGQSNNTIDEGTKYETFELTSDVKIEPVYDQLEEKEIKGNLVSIVPIKKDDECHNYVYSDDNDNYDDDDNDTKDVDFKEEKTAKKSKSKSDNKVDCPDCDKKFSTEDILENHRLKKHSSTLLKCEFCPKTFKRMSVKNDHEKSHTRPFKCSYCGKGFGRKFDLDGHVRIHTGEKPFTCEICAKGFAMQSGLHMHKKQAHTVGKMDWACDLCEKSFIGRAHLEMHRLVHTGEKPWVCDHCGQGFALKHAMLNHSKIHTGVKDFKCETCGKEFRMKKQLEKHMMDHTGVRPFPCDECSAAFKDKNGLQEHKLSVHSDIKHFECKHCGSRFSKRTGVTRHQKMNRCSGLKATVSNFLE